MEEIKEKLKPQIIEYLNLIDVEPHEIGDEEPFFSEHGLGLDSIDSFELIVLLEREYGLKIEDPKVGREVLVNVNTMASYIYNNTQQS